MEVKKTPWDDIRKTPWEDPDSKGHPPSSGWQCIVKLYINKLSNSSVQLAQDSVVIMIMIPDTEKNLPYPDQIIQ